MIPDPVTVAKERCAALIALVQKEPWFKKEGWLIRSNDFPPNDPDCVSFNLFKKNWFDGAIHIETFFGYRGSYLKKSYVTIHISHAPIIPGTQLKRIAISKPFSDRALPIIKKWKGYTISAGKYGKQPFTFKLDAGPEMVSTIHREIVRLRTEISLLIDEAIGLS